MAITFDLPNKEIVITTPQTSVTIQELLNAIRDFEDEFIMMGETKIADAAGKQDLGGSKFVGITLTILNPWTIRFEVTGSNTSITGGNIVAIDAVQVARDVLSGPGTFISGATEASILESGVSGLTASESATLVLIEQILRNKLVTNPTTGKLELWNDAGTSKLFEIDIFEDEGGTQAYRGQGLERRERIE